MAEDTFNAERYPTEEEGGYRFALQLVGEAAVDLAGSAWEEGQCEDEVPINCSSIGKFSASLHHSYSSKMRKSDSPSFRPSAIP